MPIISPDGGYLTVLNVFRTDSPAKRERHQSRRRRGTRAVLDEVVTEVEWITCRVAHTRCAAA
jgi:hypothetical protein